MISRAALTSKPARGANRRTPQRGRRPRLWACLLLGALAACTSDGGGSSSRPADPLAASEIDKRLASFPHRRIGTEPDQTASRFLLDQMRGAGLRDVHVEKFHFPFYAVRRSEVRASGAVEGPIDHLALYYGAAGRVRAGLVNGGNARPETLDGIDVRGRAVLVEKDLVYPRSRQYAALVERGAAAHIQASAAPDGLIEMGTVRDAFEEVGSIPAFSVRAETAERLVEALGRGSIDLDLEVELEETSGTPADGWNLVGDLPAKGEPSADSSPYFLLIAHHDSWFAGAQDNGSGSAALVRIAQILAGRELSHGVRVLLSDGEEYGMIGSYSYLKSRWAERDRILAVVNLDSFLWQRGSWKSVLGLSSSPALHAAISSSGVGQYYRIRVPLPLYLLGNAGALDNDLQGYYWSGGQGLNNPTYTPYLHTEGDTPETIDLALLDEMSEAYARLVLDLQTSSPEEFAASDVPRLSVDLVQIPEPGVDLPVRCTVRSPDGRLPVPGVTLRWWLTHDDFMPLAEGLGSPQGPGRYDFTVPGATLAESTCPCWLQVRAQGSLGQSGETFVEITF